MGKNPCFSYTERMTENKYDRLATSEGKKSRVPLGIEGF